MSRFFFMLNFLLNFLLAMSLLSSNTYAANPYPDVAVTSNTTLPNPASTKSILVFGDSLSAAYGIPQQKGWVNLMQQRLQKENLDYQVANASISGETTSGGLSRISAALKSHQPDLVLIELGANDGLRGLPLVDMQSNLRKMIEASQQAKARVVLIGMMIPPNYGPRYTREFNETYSNLAKEYKLALVPFLLADVAGKAELNQEDRLHPTAEAQPLVLENVWKVLQSELARKRGR